MQLISFLNCLPTAIFQFSVSEYRKNIAKVYFVQCNSRVCNKIERTFLAHNSVRCLITKNNNNKQLGTLNKPVLATSETERDLDYVFSSAILEVKTVLTRIISIVRVPSLFLNIDTHRNRDDEPWRIPLSVKLAARHDCNDRCFVALMNVPMSLWDGRRRIVLAERFCNV